MLFLLDCPLFVSCWLAAGRFWSFSWFVFNFFNQSPLSVPFVMDFYLFFFFLEDFCRQQFACTIRSGAPWWRWGRARGLPFPFLLPVVGRFSHTLIERGEEIGTSTFFSDNSVGEGSHRNHLFFSGFLRFYGVLFCHVRFCKEWFSF